jgi:hypothetical protein
MMRNLKWISATAAVAALASVSAASAETSAEDDNVRYTVKRGDTLIGLAKRYFARTNSYKIVQVANHIANPNTLPTGKTLIIPRALLKYSPSQARILSVRGNVVSNEGSVVAGQAFGEGTRLTTSAGSFVTLGLENGSRISLPSNSGLRIKTLRNYILGGSLDYDFDLSAGGAQSKVTPLKSSQDRYRIRTPKAVSAVRGTDYQVRVDGNSGADFAEVVEGGLSISAGTSTQLPLPAGEGLALMANGNAVKETLLPEPKLLNAGKLQADPEISFAADPSDKETGYRFTLSADAGFVEQIADQVVAAPNALFADIDNGNYFVRARGISAAGIQGMPVTFSFKRRLNGVSAAAGKGEDGYAFKWQTTGTGKTQFHFQMYEGQASGIPMVDEPAVLQNQITLSDLPPGTYFWRVGSVQFLDGETATNWTEFEKLSVAP